MEKWQNEKKKMFDGDNDNVDDGKRETQGKKQTNYTVRTANDIN